MMSQNTPSKLSLFPRNTQQSTPPLAMDAPVAQHCGMGGLAPLNASWWPEDLQVRRVGMSSRDLGIDDWN